ncbi:MAG: hypothetical protein WCH98_06995 [Verrucomicrobiota bacterium]
MNKHPLDQSHAAFNPAANLIRGPVGSVGYHTRLPPGTSVHHTRGSAYYANALLMQEDPGLIERGHDVLRTLLSLQETDPTSEHFGIWSWYLEEPVGEMAPADWNWADFIGAQLAEILNASADKLPADLLEATRHGLRCAAWSIFRRNSGPAYTNISVMGACVTMAAGELLAEPLLLDYGRRRLRSLRELTDTNGGFAEYNSPNYTLVALGEFERILHLLSDGLARADALHLLHRTWELIAAQYHAGTGQWSGAQCRRYGEWIHSSQVAFFKARGITIPELRAVAGQSLEGREVQHPLPCPQHLLERFARLPECPLETRQVWVVNGETKPDVVTTTWFDEVSTLGSVNADTAWEQRRLVNGYWRTGDGSVARVRLRVLHNGRDFASALVHSDQSGQAVLSAIHFISGQGEYHPHFGKSPNGDFATRDLRVRYEVEGGDSRIEELDRHTFALAAGGMRAIIHCGPGWLEDRPVERWETGRDGNLIWLDAIMHTGEEIPLHTGEPGGSALAIAMELVPEDHPPEPSGIRTESDGQWRAFTWDRGSRQLRVTL